MDVPVRSRGELLAVCQFLAVGEITKAVRQSKIPTAPELHCGPDGLRLLH